MRQNITLYIDGKRADCDTATLILMNYTREELSNPTIVRNSYSQRVTLPSTAANDRIFSSYYRHDFRTAAGFSPLVRVPFLLQSDTGEVLERGYLKLDSVAYTGRFAHSYSCTLYGGLGGFFYGLTYNEDGSKKTLSDIVYRTSTQAIDPHDTQMPITAASIKMAWDRLAASDGEIESIFDIVNFAPCYNGIPSCKFSADKGVYKAGDSAHSRVQNLYTQKTEEGVTYTPMTGANGYILVELENEHTSEETQDMRAYLQRPVFRVKALLDALTWTANTGGYFFALDHSQLFTEEYEHFMRSWFTLQMFDRDRIDPEGADMDQVIGETATPADYLIGIAKMFGCVFHYDAPTNTITMMCRDQFYDTGLDAIDLTQRIATDKERKTEPLPFSHKYYEFALDTDGEYAKQYAERYGRTYGSMLVDTGYDFDPSTESMFDAMPFKGAADVQESSRHFFVYGGAADPQMGASLNYCLKFAFTEQVHFKLYHRAGDGKDTEIDCQPTTEPIHGITYADGYADFMARPQLHGAENEAIEGAGVLLFFDGFVDTPVYEAGHITIYEAIFRLTDDNTAMSRLNAGAPCWDFSTDAGIMVQSLPNFRRWSFAAGRAVDSMFDFGIPRAVRTPEVPGQQSRTMYDDWWRAYIEDRYNTDSRVLKCSVDLRGLGSIPALLRRFFWYEGSLWSLNKISNHSLTTLDPTECEFIRVQNVDNYTNGQLIR